MGEGQKIPYLDGDQSAARVVNPHPCQLSLAYQRDDVWEVFFHPSHERCRAGDSCKVCRWRKQGTCK